MSHEKLPDDPVLRAIARRREKKNFKSTPQARPPKRETKKTEEGLMVNPLTKRPMKIGGRAHKAYLKKIAQGQETTVSLPTPSRKRKKFNPPRETYDTEIEQLVNYARALLPAAEVDTLFTLGGEGGKEEEEEEEEVDTTSEYSEEEI